MALHVSSCNHSFLRKIKAYQYQISSDIRMRLFFVLNTDLTGKVIIENITVTIGANTDYSYVPYKTGYVLVAVHGTTFAGIYATGFADTGSNYSVFYNVASGQTASITLSLMWVKI